MAQVDNSVLIRAPLEFVWDSLNEIENWPNLFSEYAEATVLSRDGDTVRFRLTTYPDPENDNTVWSWVSERTVDPVNHTSRAHRIETGPFEYMNINWYFEPVADGTKMRWVQEFTMKPSAPANDEQAVDYLNRNTRTQMDVIKERLEQSAKEATPTTDTPTAAS